MRTITYERILQRLCALIGMPRDDLQTDEEAMLRQFINRAHRRIHDHSAWPQVCVIEARTPVAGLIDWAQTDETPIDTVFTVYDADPLATTEADKVAYALNASGIQLTGSLQASTDDVYVSYRARCPDLNGDAYAAGVAYSTNDQAYYATTGDFYRAKQASTGNLPTNTTYWERLTIPYDFAEYIAHGAYADWLRSEGMNEKAIAQANTTADMILADALDKVERQQGVQPPIVFNTHLSAQST